MTQLERIKNGLGLTTEQAQEILDFDKSIDQGKPSPYDLNAEQKKIAKQYTKAGIKTSNTTPKNRTYKENATKSALILDFFHFLTENCAFSIENCEILNKERQISFKIGENDYELTLIQKRKSKN